jgi:hypothetical protein
MYVSTPKGTAMYDAACTETLGHVRCDFNVSPAEIAKAYGGCSEHYILNIERGHVQVPDNYFEVLARLMQD